MINYLLRRVVYGILILLGVNLITFVLFFAVNTPDDMARLNLGGSHWALCLSDVHFLALLHHCGPVALFKADAAFPHFRMGGRLGMHGILGAAGADCALFAFGQRYAPLSSDVSRGNRPRLCSYGTRQGVI